MTVFETAAIDLDRYLTHIGHSGRVSVDLETLAAIALRHPLTIPFENLNPLLGRPVSLDITSLQQKLLRDGRGGWCFEHNVLLGTALSAIGFHVHGLGARVLWNVPPGVVSPRSHMVLLVDLGGQPLIVDAGFGGLTLTAPLRLEADVEQQTPHDTFRLARADDYYVLDARVGGEWRGLYKFDLQPQVLADYEVSNWFLCNHPRSIFVNGLMVARARSDRRLALRNTDLSIHHRDGYTERRTLTTGGEVRTTLEQLFGINVPTGPEVDAMFDRLVAAYTAPAAT